MNGQKVHFSKKCNVLALPEKKLISATKLVLYSKIMNFGAPLPSTYKFKFFYYLVLVVLFLALISLKRKIHVLIEISRNIVYNDVYELVTIYIADLSPLSLNQLSQVAVTSYCSKSNYPSTKKKMQFSIFISYSHILSAYK